MIATLIREQVRSQSRYAAAAFALTAIATSLAAFALISLATNQRESDRVYTFVIGNAENRAWTPVWTNGPPVGQDTPARVEDTLTVAELDTLVAQLAAEDAEPQIRYGSLVWMTGDPVSHTVAAMDSVPESALREGTAPQPGEVVVDQALATANNLAVGDSLGFAPGRGLPTTMTLEVSGILRGTTASAPITPTRLVVNMADGRRLIEESGFISGTTASGERTAVMDVFLAWNGPVPNALANATYENHNGPASIGPWGFYAVPALVLVVVIALVAAAAAGRSQGAARTQWVGTVRALGATRRDVVNAAILETLAVGAIAGLVGVTVGAAVESYVVRRQGGTFAGDWPVFTASAIGVSLLLALILSLILGAVPAYWAARTTPAAALNPVSPADATRTRPSIATVWLAVVAAASALLWVQRTAADAAGADWPIGAILVLGIVSTTSVYLLISRFMVRAVARLGTMVVELRPRILVAAGSGLIQHPRGAASIATAIATGGIGAGAMVWQAVVQPRAAARVVDTQPWATVLQNAGIATLTTAALLGAAASVLAVAVWIGRGRVAGDAAVYGALGLSRQDRQAAAMVQVGLSAFAGGLCGMVTGTVAAGAATVLLAASGTWSLPSIASSLPIVQGAVVWLGALLGVALVSAATSLVAGRASDGPDPAALRRSASREGATF